MLGAKLFGLARRMQGVGKQQESRELVGFTGIGAEHSGLAPSVGMAAEKKSAGYGFAKGGYGVAQSHAIAFGIAGKRRSGAPLLAKGEIAAENDVAIRGEAFSQRHEQGSIAIRACAVGQDEGVAVGIRRRVQEAAHGGH